MKRSFCFTIFALMVMCANSQEIGIDLSKVTDAIKNNKPLPTSTRDFSDKSTKLKISVDEKLNETELASVQKSLEFVNPKTDQVFQFSNAVDKGISLIIVDFAKVGLNTAPEGMEVILRTVAKPKMDVLKIVNKKAADGEKKDNENESAASPAVPYWKYLPERVIDLQRYTIPYDFCCDTCRTCEDTMLIYNNRIIYDAISGLTQYIPYDFSRVIAGDTTYNIHCNICPPGNQYRAGRQGYIVRNGHPIVLKAGDPLVYIVKNVNPYLYDVELSDSAFLVNNESNALLNDKLFSKIEGQADDGSKEKEEPDQAYLRAKAGLIALRAELGQLLENYRVMSRFAHNCIEEKKRLALGSIDSFLNNIGKHPVQSFSSFVDIYLDPASIDSSLNKNLKALYGEFWRSKYVIAYRFPEVPVADQVNFNLSIKRKKDSPYPDLLAAPKYPTQTAYVKKFFKIDVSSGLYIAGFGNKEYTTRADSNLNVTPALRGSRIVKESSGNNEFGFASFLHFYYKTGVWTNVGFHIGAGINFKEDPQPRYFTGASLMLGSNNRLCLNSGLIWGNVKELSDQYPREVDGNYRWLPVGETNLVIKNKFKNSWFVSISYNLPFLKRNKGAADIKPPAKEEKEVLPETVKKK
jgi:hypothetical protein